MKTLLYIITILLILTTSLQAQESNSINDQDTDLLGWIEQNAENYKVYSLSINSHASDFAPSVKGKVLTFTTARDYDSSRIKLKEWKNKPFLNLYSATLTESGDAERARRLPKEVNTKTHESSPAYTKDGKTVYFTRNNSSNGNFSWDKKGVSRLKIFKANIQNGEWTNSIELPFSGGTYSVSHPSLNADETKLYFASDMPGSLGASDIFVVDIHADGSYGKPVNLGPKINTESRETFPFMTDSDILYFTSDGHPGLGGFDVFATKIEEEGDLKIVNLGEPINSSQDDFSFIINWKNNKGFFASNREGGMGSDDIYSFKGEPFTPEKGLKQLLGNVVDKEGNTALVASTIIVTVDGNIVAKTESDSNGNFKLELDRNLENYTIEISLPDYEPFTLRVPLDISDTDPILVYLNRSQPKIATDLAEFLKLDPIYFDLNSSYLNSAAKTELDKVVKYLKEHPKVKINVSAHADIRGSDEYNLWLSERRARRTAEYLISRGLNKKRITSEWLGESQPVNPCKDKVGCTETDHNINRRSEFIVVEN
jgi:outer membrane protein OmpA-like peptidoglycan-associated protein